MTQTGLGGTSLVDGISDVIIETKQHSAGDRSLGCDDLAGDMVGPWDSIRTAERATAGVGVSASQER